MTNDSTPGERLRSYRRDAKLTTDELGRRAGMVLGRDKALSAPTIRAHENGTNGISADMAEAYARVLRVKPSDILFGPVEGSGIAPPDTVRMIEVIGEIKVGSFVDPAQAIDSPETVPVSLPEYARADLFALRVTGRAMDRCYPDGAIIIACPPAEAGIRESDHVVIRRWRGDLAETGLREIIVGGGTIMLRPHSTDPQLQTDAPLIPAEDTPDAPEIIGVVVGSFHARSSRTGPLLAG